MADELDTMIDQLEILDRQSKSIVAKKMEILSALSKKLDKCDKDVKRKRLEMASRYCQVQDLAKTSLIRPYKQMNLPIPGASSFKNLMVIAARRRQLSKFNPDWDLDKKLEAYKFIDQLGVARPRMLVKGAPLIDLVPEPCTVIKPVSGGASKGVFVVGEAWTKNIATGEVFPSSEVIPRAKTCLSDGTIKQDSWIVEEYVGAFEEGVPVPPRDVKFFCFFGKVGLISEIDRRNTAKFCWWMPNGEEVKTGYYEDNAFSGDGFSAEERRLAERISAHIMAPFIRIDFLRVEGGLSFGEFTPVPGAFTDFNEEFDRYLGDMYLEAEARIFEKAAETGV